MTGQDFINLLLLKKGNIDYSNKVETLDDLDEEITFKDLSEELDNEFKEYREHVKAPITLYYLLNKEKWLKEKPIEVISSYVNMLQMKSDNTDWSPQEDEKIGFEVLGGTLKRTLDCGLITPTLNPYKSCVSYKKVLEFLNSHPGFWVSLESSLDKEYLSKEVVEAIKRLENI